MKFLNISKEESKKYFSVKWKNYPHVSNGKMEFYTFPSKSLMEVTGMVFNYSDLTLFGNLISLFSTTTTTMLLSEMLLGTWRAVTQTGKILVLKMIKTIGIVEEAALILVIPDDFFVAILSDTFDNLPNTFDEQKKFMDDYKGKTNIFSFFTI